VGQLRSSSNESSAEAPTLPSIDSESLDAVQQSVQEFTIHDDGEDVMSDLETSGSESWALSGFSPPSHPNEEIEDQHSSSLRKIAGSITNMAYQFSTFSRNDEALSLYREAVEIRRQLARRDNEVYLYELTQALHQLAHHLRLMKRDEEGIAFDSEVVAIRRDLATKNPDEYLLSLAQGIHMLGHIYNCVQRPQEGLPFIREEVEIYRKLCSERPSYQADLAQALHGLAHQLRLAGLEEESMTPDLEALKLLCGLSDRR
jgi:tetratricopeptide (TPR) repeat protein